MDASIQIDDSGNGIIVLETGNHNLASAIADEWFFWKAVIADYVVMQRNKSYLLTLLISGYVMIIALSVFILRRKKMQKKASEGYTDN